MKQLFHLKKTTALLLFCLSMAVSLSAQFGQQGAKLVGTGNTGAAYQGSFVALSTDGNTALVSGVSDNSNAGAVWVYTRSGSTWTQQGSKLVGSGATGAAWQSRVALSGDGNTALVGGWGDNSNQGAVWVFTRSGSTWTQQGTKLVGTGNTGAARQGISVALSRDGNTALVGGSTDNSNAGAVWVFTRSGSTWTQQGTKLVGTGATGAAGQGYSVALSNDGNTALVGGVSDNSSVGATWVFTRSGSTWTQQGSKLVGTGNTGGSYQGASVSLSNDGNTALVGGMLDNVTMSGTAGAVWVFTRSGSTWTQQGSKLVGTGATGGARQGTYVALSSDGNKALVGGSTDNSNQGAVWAWTRSGSTWTQLGSKLVGTGNTGAAQQGNAVALSGDGNTALVGGPNDNTNQGAAWVYASCNCDPACNPLPTAAGTYTATTSRTDAAGFTHYCDGAGNLLLSTKPVSASSNTTINPGDVRVEVVTAPAVGTYTQWCGAASFSASTCMMTDPSTSGLINRRWHITAVQGTAIGLTNRLEVAFYCTTSDYNTLNTTVTAAGGTALTNSNEMKLYLPAKTLNLGAFPTPRASNIVHNKVFRFSHAATPSTATWTQSTPQTGIIQANFHISTILNSGGIGKF